MDNRNLYFFIEPYVYISKKKNNVLFYNTLNGFMLCYNDNLLISKIAARLLSVKNLYVIKISSKEFINTQIKKFISKIRNNFMGDVLHSSQTKPIQIAPFVKVKDDFRRFKFEENNWNDINIVNMINELSVFLNSNKKLSLKTPNNTYKQFQFPYYQANNECEIDINNIINIISSLNHSIVYKINFLGNNILNYTHINELVKFLNSFDIQKEYFFLYNDIFEKDFLSFVKSLDKQSTINISITFPLNSEDFSIVYDVISKMSLDINFQLIISTSRQLQHAETFIHQFRIEKYLFKPLYTANNLHFFKEYVFLSRKEIVNTNLSLEDIYARQLINEYEYGKLTIMPNGKIYANLNDPALGNISKHNLRQIILKEIIKGKSWKRTRSQIIPCKYCVFQDFCPPISNYELIIGQYNLCRLIK